MQQLIALSYLIHNFPTTRKNILMHFRVFHFQVKHILKYLCTQTNTATMCHHILSSHIHFESV